MRMCGLGAIDSTDRYKLAQVDARTQRSKEVTNETAEPDRVKTQWLRSFAPFRAARDDNKFCVRMGEVAAVQGARYKNQMAR